MTHRPPATHSTSGRAANRCAPRNGNFACQLNEVACVQKASYGAIEASHCGPDCGAKIRPMEPCEEAHLTRARDSPRNNSGNPLFRAIFQLPHPLPQTSSAASPLGCPSGIAKLLCKAALGRAHQAVYRLPRGLGPAASTCARIRWSVRRRQRAALAFSRTRIVIPFIRPAATTE